MKALYWPVLLTVFQSCLGQELTTWYQDLQFLNKMPAGFTASWDWFPVDVTGDCALACLKQNDCQGFFYHEVTKTCKTSSSRYMLGGTEVAAPGYRYYRRQQASCPSSSVLYQPTQTCFKLYDQALTWDLARDHCASQGGRLAVLDSRDKADFFMAYVNGGGVTGTYYHVGACRPYDRWGSYPPGGVSDYRWFSGVLVDWDYYRRRVYTISERPRWATLHPDHWAEREVAEWLVHVVDEYDLQGHRGQEGHGARQEADRLVRAFAGVTGRRLALMTLTDFVQLEPRHGLLLFTLFHGVLSAGRLSAQTSGFPPGARPLTPIREVLDSPRQASRAGVDRAVPPPQEQPLNQAEPDQYAQSSGPESCEDDK